MPKKVLITGASGLLGLELLRYLNSVNFNVVGIYNNNRRLTDNAFKNLKCDISNVKSVNLLAEKIDGINMIFHCASMTNIDRCEKNKKACWQSNVVGTRNMVDLAKRNKAKLIYISTGSIFSGEHGNYKEYTVPEPKNFYSWTKLVSEESVLSYEKGLVVRVTPIGIHGIGRPQANFIEWLMDSVKSNKSFNLFNDVYINAISTESLAKVLLKISKVLERGIIHVGSKDRLSKAEIGQIIINKFPNFSGKVKLTSVNNAPGDFASRPKEMWLNVDKANKLGLKMPNLKKEVGLILKRF